MIWSAIQWPKDIQLVKDYNRAPNCTPTAVPTGGLPPCTFAKYPVTYKEYDSGKGGGNYFMTIAKPSGSQTIGVAMDFYNAVPLGATLVAKMWMGKVIRIDYGSYWTSTDDHPEAQLLDDQRLFWTSFALLCSVVAIIFAAWFDNRNRLMRRSQPIS